MGLGAQLALSAPFWEMGGPCDFKAKKIKELISDSWSTSSKTCAWLKIMNNQVFEVQT